MKHCVQQKQSNTWKKYLTLRGEKQTKKPKKLWHFQDPEIHFEIPQEVDAKWVKCY